MWKKGQRELKRAFENKVLFKRQANYDILVTINSSISVKVGVEVGA